MIETKMNELKIFKFEETINVRTIIDSNNEPYFIAKDIAVAMGYQHPSSAVSDHCIEGINVQSFRKQALRTGGGIGTYPIEIKDLHPQTILIREFDIIRLIKNSKIATLDLKKRFISFLEDNKLISKNAVFMFESRKEINFFNSLKEFLIPFNISIKTQFNCHKYRIDCYIKDLDLVIEYDENFHKYYNYDLEQVREEFIKNKLKCNIIRISDKYSDATNLGIIVNKLVNDSF